MCFVFNLGVLCGLGERRVVAGLVSRKDRGERKGSWVGRWFHSYIAVALQNL